MCACPSSECSWPNLPYSGHGSSGLGKPLKSILHTDPALPIFLGATGESTIRLAAELCDGLLPMGFVPRLMPLIRPWIEEGFRRSGGRQSWERFEVQPSVTVTVTDDVKATFEAMKPHVALTVGGMGHRDVNFHKNAMIRRGYADVAERIQELFLAGHKDEAAAIVPDEYCDDECLTGSPDRIRKQFEAWATCGITGLTIRTEQPESMRVLAAAARDHV